MTDKKTSEPKAKTRLEEEFAALTLEEKIASLMRMEAATLGETLTYIANTSAKAMDKAGDFIHDISEKIENEVKKAAAATASSGGKTSSGPAKAAEPKAKASTKRPPKPKAAK
ncbi:MAG: hypothetical protein WBO10_14025 [Pyrinomonadaceae bacterium]